MPNPTTKSRQELRSRFVRNAIPSETDFADLIGASLNQADDGLLKLSDGSFGLVNPSQKAEQPVPVLRFFADPTAEGGVWQLQLGTGGEPSLSLAAADGKPVLLLDGSTRNVGIGTAAPSHKLDVAGSARVSGSLQISQKTMGESENNYHLEVFAPDSGAPGDYTKIRFNQGNQYWAWLGYHGLSQNSSGEFVFWNLNQNKEARARCGDLVAKGNVIRSLWAASGNGPDETTNMGQIASRILRITKSFADTALRIAYCDNFRVAGENVACRWEIRVDGNSVSPPIIADRYEELGNRHHHGTIMGFARGVAAGAREIQVWIVEHPYHYGQKVNAYTPVETDAHTGWYHSTWTLEAEEVWIPESIPRAQAGIDR